MGINVFGMRYIGVMISGLFGGLGGGVYASTIALDFTHSTISGQGFIALAALVSANGIRSARSGRRCSSDLRRV